MHYRWMREDPEYKAEFALAHEEAIQCLEDEAVRRAHEGLEEPLVYQGQFTYASYNKKTKKGIGPPLAIRKYSDQLLMFLLRAARPEKYRERFQMEHTGMIGVESRLQAARKRMAKHDTGKQPG